MTETHIAIVGAGDMGHGFAAHFAGHGKDVTLVDHRQSNIDRARERVAEVAAFLSAEGLVDRDPRQFETVSTTPSTARQASPTWTSSSKPSPRTSQ
ncbi:3-hydroxyacyl-CoA dehydrogenase NAD-binding domain-containing protein [Haladaptatus sp. GCM10025707]|uniref:3-hydroxyacyl-CoA dehydrogenase NAD-binding domain-containing protein n=1 Tax=Haladaptatus sp. GCM10025707 TaxID=3252658 RepID=UPI00360E0E43